MCRGVLWMALMHVYRPYLRNNYFKDIKGRNRDVFRTQGCCMASADDVVGIVIQERNRLPHPLRKKAWVQSGITAHISSSQEIICTFGIGS